MYRLLTTAIVVICVLTGSLVHPVTTAGTLAQAESTLPAIEAATSPNSQQTVEAAISKAARTLSRLEARHDYAGLYEMLHPDSRSRVPFDAFRGWYEDLLAGKTTDELTITGINFIDWTWGVTGQTYFGTAQVTFTQPYWVNGVREDVDGVFHLVEHDDDWYWFFGGSQAFIDQQIARYASAELGPEAIVVAGAEERARRFPDILHAHVDAYWALQFAAAGRAYDSPGGVVGFDSPMETGCGVADPITEAAFYCVLDQTIYYSEDFRNLIESQIGDFGWIVVIAHEWGHHVQLELGTDLVGALDQTGSLAPILLEQQADCLAGAYARNAEDTGWLDDTDLDEAVYMTSLSGDPVGTSWGDPNAHGTGEERVDAFLEGYSGGLASCDLSLDPDR